jgi:hypothetical protein
MTTTRVTLLAALAASAIGTLYLGAGTAGADEVKPGLNCDVDNLWGNVSCTNTTDIGYTVTLTRELYKSCSSFTRDVKITTYFVPPQSSGIVGDADGCKVGNGNPIFSLEPPPAP